MEARRGHRLRHEGMNRVRRRRRSRRTFIKMSSNILLNRVNVFLETRQHIIHTHATVAIRLELPTIIRFTSDRLMVAVLTLSFHQSRQHAIKTKHVIKHDGFPKNIWTKRETQHLNATTETTRRARRKSNRHFSFITFFYLQI